MTIRGVVTAAAGTTINNIATVVGDEVRPDLHDLGGGHDPGAGQRPRRRQPRPDDRQERTAPASTPGTGITYTLTVNNLGTGNALGVKVTDTFPAGIAPVTRQRDEPVRLQRRGPDRHLRRTAA